MTTIDTRPQAVELKTYSGDTLTFKINSNIDYSTYTWSGQIRKAHDVDLPVDAPDAEFEFGSVTDNGDGTFSVIVVLDSETTEALAIMSQSDDLGLEYVKIGVANAPSLQSYKGVWDVQVADNSTPPVVLTLVQGTITVDADVTRV